MKIEHEFINTVEEGAEETHSQVQYSPLMQEFYLVSAIAKFLTCLLCFLDQVKQMHLVAPLDTHFSILYSILLEHISEDVEFKASNVNIYVGFCFSIC